MRFREYFNGIKEGTFTPGLTKVLGKPMCLKKVCDKCGFMMPKYTGRYPRNCPNCGDPVDDNDKEIQVRMQRVRSRMAGDAGLNGMPIGEPETLEECRKAIAEATVNIDRDGAAILRTKYSKPMNTVIFLPARSTNLAEAIALFADAKNWELVGLDQGGRNAVFVANMGPREYNWMLDPLDELDGMSYQRR